MSGRVVHFEIPDLHYSMVQAGPTAETGFPSEYVEGNLMGLWQARTDQQA